ncbi:hypothetical protein FRB94_009037 [Tulasnella sp. JGI-2019a]|nr:hypothetical protein FRB94_009037 [Tulasnella sp. JGI-2019a]
MDISPGVRYLIFTVIPETITPIIAVCATIHYCVSYVLPTFGKGVVVFLDALVICISIKLYSIYNARQQAYLARQMNAIPVPIMRGPWGLPGNIDVLWGMLKAFDEDYSGQFQADLEDTWGDLYNFRVLGEDIIFTTNPAYVKQFLVTDFPNWIKGDDFIVPMKGLLGDGVFNSDGAMWKFHRSATRPFFAKERIVDFETFAKHAEGAILKIKERGGEPVDFQDIAGRFTMDSATSFLFGESVDSMAAPLSLPHRSGANCGGSTSQQLGPATTSFSSAFKTALGAYAHRLFIGKVWPLWEISGDKAKDSVRLLHEYIDPIVDRGLSRKGKLGSSAPKEVNCDIDDNATLLDHLVSVTDDKTVIRDELLNLLLAGRDTTSHAITAVIYFLATEDPSIMATLRKEILDVVGPGKVAPTFDQTKGMKYLRAVVNETLRLMPSIPGNIRHSVEASVWTNPSTGIRYYMPKHTRAAWSTLMMGRRKDLWGPDALIFDPMRWLDGRNKKYFLSNPFMFLPFHAGPRICLGQQFALNEMSFFVTRLLQNFGDISFAPDAFTPGTLPPPEWKANPFGRKAVEKAWPRSHLTMYFAGGLWLRMRETKS